MKTVLIAVVLMLGLSACTYVHQDSQGPKIVLTPVKYQLDIQLKDDEFASEKLKDFVNRHRDSVHGQTLTLIWYNETGHRFINQLSFSEDRDYSVEVEEAKEPSDHFDIRVEFEKSQLMLERCHRDRIEDYGSQVGCSVENARWQSMVNPYKAI